jgi:ribosome-binding protein aMBF1 (putative translation factor)
VTDTPTPTPEDLIAGIADMLGSLRAEIDRESQESPGMAMPLARQLLAVLREETAEASALYSRVVYRLREERKLSLAQLATQLDVSKQYVADMVNRGKALEEGSGT